MTNLVHRPDTPTHALHGIVGNSPAMRLLLKHIRKAGQSDATVLIRGESGTGKELVAQALHLQGRRSKGPFRAVNCATFTAELLATELFGHRKGAFTGAVADREGLLSQADGGTLFLDEVAELAQPLQGRMLRVLQERRFVPVGGTAEQSVDVRFVSATNTSLRDLVSAKRFREDLMYRLRVVVLYLPPLRERGDDLAMLTWFFIDEFNARCTRTVQAIDGEAWRAFQSYGWPGNVRELRNNIEQAFVLGEGSVLTLDELAPELRGIDYGAPPVFPTRESITAPLPEQASPSSTVPGINLEELERQQLLEAWQSTGGKRGPMAERLGMSRSTLYRKLKHHGLI